jgi:hypothetical protein
MKEDKPANEAQKKLFFALINDGGYDADVMKERAKKKYKLEHFNDISSIQISELIDKLQNKVAFAGYEQATSGETIPPQTENKKYTYQFSVSVLASHFKAFRDVLEKVSTGVTDIFGDKVGVDARIPIGTITVKVAKELKPEEIKVMAGHLENDFRERISIPTIIVEAKKVC